MTEHERTLLSALADLPEEEFPARRMPGEVAVGLGMPPLRAVAVLRGLEARGFYEYDISPYSGRLTRAGREAAQRMRRT